MNRNEMSDPEISGDRAPPEERKPRPDIISSDGMSTACKHIPADRISQQEDDDPELHRKDLRSIGDPNALTSDAENHQ